MSDGVEETGDLENNAVKTDDKTRFNSCYEAHVGHSRVINGEGRAELEVNNTPSERNVNSDLGVDIIVFEKPVSVVSADFNADALNPKASGKIVVFGKEVWSSAGSIPEFKIAYTADKPKKYEITYGVPIPKFLVNPELTTGLQVSGDVFSAIKPLSKADNQINFDTRLAGGSYARPHASASFSVNPRFSNI